jgi:hypothetical protein
MTNYPVDEWEEAAIRKRDTRLGKTMLRIAASFPAPDKKSMSCQRTSLLQI